MKNLLLITATVLFMRVCEAQIDSIDYFGQVPPGPTPAKFAPGFISKDGRYELMSAFSPNGKEFCFTVTNNQWSSFSIWYTKYDGANWSEPNILSFAASGFSPVFSPLGDALLFSTGGNWSSKTASIWICKRTDTIWGTPAKLNSPVNLNSGNNNWGFSMASDSTLLFTSVREGGKGNFDLYISEFMGGGYTDVSNLENLNSSAAEYSAFIASDKSYIIFSSQRSGGYGWDDLYISFQKADRNWTNPINLGPKINTVHAEFSPHVTPDGKYMIYSKWDANSNWSDIYWVRIDNLIDSLKNKSIIFYDNYEDGFTKWEVEDTLSNRILSTGDPLHKHVLSLKPNNTAQCVLIKNSSDWSRYKIEGDVLFPTDGDSYMGFVYDYNKTADRIDFGCLYVKGNSNYVKVNPHRDGNASRSLYEEITAPLTGADIIYKNTWYHFKAEIIDSVCHFYFNDMTIPKITFSQYEFSRGSVGFKPRITGDDVWIDNIEVTSISDFAYKGGIKPDNIEYHPDELITNWYYIGPLTERNEMVEKDEIDLTKEYSINGLIYKWENFEADQRGCVVVGRVSRYVNAYKHTYFTTVLNANKSMTAKFKASC
jgi:hypothetical protein